MLYDLSSSDVITSDKKTMICDSYILWQIDDPLKFAQTLNSSISNAESRLDTIVYNSTKNIISSTTQNDVISGRDGELAAAIMKNIGNNSLSNTVLNCSPSKPNSWICPVTTKPLCTSV